MKMKMFGARDVEVQKSHIQVSVPVGTSVTDAYIAALFLSIENNCPVRFTHNGVTIHANPFDIMGKLDQVKKQYEHDLKAMLSSEEEACEQEGGEA